MSPSSPEDGPSESPTASHAASSAAHEPLACVSCRSRKLKCDRQKPVCTRCVRAGGECIYPESRRKPAVKRRNVRELEERLAQVEGLLKHVGKQRATQPNRSDGAQTEDSSPQTLAGESSQPERPQPSPQEGPLPWSPVSPRRSPAGRDSAPSGELLGLGQFESLPPFQMIEDLHAKFFMMQPYLLPIIHQGNYLRAFHSPPHMRPPMSLQYAIWTIAANGDPKYGCYHDILYRRARQYLEADELKGHGEHFITLGHAQAWALVGGDEARCLLFTRASMSSAKAVRLVGMMGLHRLDSTLSAEDLPMMPMIPPPRSWAELEERRRLFWGCFCIDSYGAISAGWPSLIDMDQITTHLPATEDAFNNGVEEKTATLQDAFRGSNYSPFGANIVVCHIFARLMKHAHRPMPDDHPEDLESGAFWKHHRELDNMLSSAFMFLPERFRLPRNLRDPAALQTNMNLHAAVICLHLAAHEKAERHGLAATGQASLTRALNAAREIVDIIKNLRSQRVVGHKGGPLMALSLYLAASVFILTTKDNSGDGSHKANLELVINCMNATGRQHFITLAYLHQLMVEIEHNDIPLSLDDPTNLAAASAQCMPHAIPLVALGAAIRRTKVQPFLTRPTVRVPKGTILYDGGIPPSLRPPFVGSDSGSGEMAGPASKRMRTSGPASSSMSSAQSTDTSGSQPLGESGGSGTWSYTSRHPGMTNTTTTLPHRTGSPAINTASARAVPPAPRQTTTSSHVPHFPVFTLPVAQSAPAFSTEPHLPSAGLGTATVPSFSFQHSTSTTTTTTTSAHLNTGTGPGTGTDTTTAGLFDTDALGDLGAFESLGEWGLNDPESLYAMLLDVGGEEFGGGAAGDDDGSMDAWAAALGNPGGGSGSGSAGGGTGSWGAAGGGRGSG